MLLGAATRIWLEGALCHENSKICEALITPIGHKYGGGKEVTVMVWIRVGQTRDQPTPGSQGVDNHLLFPK